MLSPAVFNLLQTFPFRFRPLSLEPLLVNVGIRNPFITGRSGIVAGKSVASVIALR